MFSLFHKEGPVLAPQASVEVAPKSAEFSADASIASTESGQQDVGALPQAETPLRQECGASDAGQVPVPTPESGPEPRAAETVQRALLPAVAPLVPCIVSCAQGSKATRDPLPVDEPSGSWFEEPCAGPTTEQPGAASAEVGEEGPEAERAADGVPRTCRDDGITAPDDVLTPDDDGLWLDAPMPPRRAARRATKGRQLRLPDEARRHTFTPQQRLLLLDTWRRSGLPAGDFAALVGLSKHTLYKWKQLFEQQGPAGLMDQPRGAPSGSRLPELTKRTILMLKEQHPDWGCQRISDLLLRGPALPASASAVARVLHEAGYEGKEEPTRPHPQRERRFERAKPNQLWQTDMFTFMLKRQNRRVYLVAFLDDHSRFVVSFGLHASQSTALVLEVLEAAIANYGPPEEILTDNGAQYVTWRGKSQFTKRLEQRGIRQLVSRPQRPQTLGKIERLWGTLWREFLESAVFADLEEARRRIGHFIDYYNFQRPHRGAGGLVPADRFFHAAPAVLRTLKERVTANALELARYGQPKSPFYVTGQVAGQTFSVHAEGERLVLRRQGHEREEIELTAPAKTASGNECDRDGTAAAESMPAPLCPDGSPRAGTGEPGCAPPLVPGQTALDVRAVDEATGGTVPERTADALPEDALPEDGADEGGAS